MTGHLRGQSRRDVILILAHSIKWMAHQVAVSDNHVAHSGAMTATLISPLELGADPGGGRPASTHDDQSRAIRAAIRARSRELRDRHPVLKHQSAIGATILAASAVIVLGSAIAFIAEATAWWVALPLAAFAMSLAHEIEHDQIHRLYFKRNKVAQNVMFAVCWLLRPYAISPWARRPLHLLHHEMSGTERDIEERAITNGLAWSPKRLLMMIDPIASVVFSLPPEPKSRRFILGRVAKAYFPLTFVALGTWYTFLGLSVASAFNGAQVLPSIYAVLRVLVVVWIGPNILRVTCLHFISSNMHYYGDVEEGNVLEQTQVLNRWWLIPLQAFCFNFGSTHGIHHFVPNDPFYVRQMTAKAAHSVMRENGVRFNDLGTFRRANRYSFSDT